MDSLGRKSGLELKGRGGCNEGGLNTKLNRCCVLGGVYCSHGDDTVLSRRIKASKTSCY